MAIIILPDSAVATVRAALTDNNGTGNTLIVPDGAQDWSSGGDLTLTGCALQGPGKDAENPLNVTAGRIVVTKHASQITRLLGIRFTGNSHHVAVGGTASNQPYVIGDCYFFNDGATMCSLTTNGGLWYDVEFDAPTANSADVFAINLGGVGTPGETSWQAITTMGMDDSTGYVNNYFEDSTWNGLLEVSMDVDNGARVVIRHCIFNDSSIVLHGGGNGDGGQDTSDYGGRQLEIYNCEFNRVDGNVPVNKWLWMRGSTGVFANNFVDDSSSGTYPGKDNLRFTVGCPANPGYPMPYQFGQNTQTPETTPSQPFLVFGNTGTAISPGTLVTISGNSGEGITCSVPATYIQSGRDYVTSNIWNWVSYTYPHPLQGTSKNITFSGTATFSTFNVG